VRQSVDEEVIGVKTDAKGAADEQQGDGGGTEGLELGKAVRVASGWRFARELPAEEGDKIAKEV
jgi:hypothetical protein